MFDPLFKICMFIPLYTGYSSMRNLAISELGDNCIQNFNLVRYVVGYTVGNLVLRPRASGVVKRDFRTYNRRIGYTSPN